MTVTGLDKFKRKLDALPERVRAAAQRALEQGATELVGMQKRLVPVDKGVLRDSIRWEASAGGSRGLRSGRGSILALKGSRGLAVTVRAGDSKAFYAKWVEFGTKAQPGQPFFFPAYRALRRRIGSRVMRAMKKAIRDGARR